jgi:acetyltransferase-like isoleucine patch superfamily enzyme
VTLCDNTIIGEGVHIGAGATIIPGINIGKWCVIGAGAVITQNLPDYSLVVGVPGKIIRKLDK